MTVLATKSIHRETSYNLAQLVEQLDDVVDRAIKQRFLVVHKNRNNTYAALDYLTRTPYISNLPSRDIADRYCEIINNGRLVQAQTFKTLELLLNEYYHYLNEAAQFENAYHNAKNIVTRNTLFTRLDVAQAHVDSLYDRILYHI